ncbi:MAG TPA: SRPBCC domain-containing protein [Thermoanaerobaculia bacterium]|jgi:hypothetical protein|nr:SRPBCC domain-containing protein [Thermoanaerobaculia bacterium]
MISTMPSIEDLTLNLTLETHVQASLEATFAALLEQLGPGNETLEGKSLQLKIEPWPGGRWYRDLGGDNGHLWAHVQAIKRPTLLEFTGPLMMSAGVVSNVQYRLTEVDGGTLIKFRHSALGFFPADYRDGMTQGWTQMLTRTRQRAEAQHRGA